MFYSLFAGYRGRSDAVGSGSTCPVINSVPVAHFVHQLWSSLILLGALFRLFLQSRHHQHDIHVYPMRPAKALIASPTGTGRFATSTSRPGFEESAEGLTRGGPSVGFGGAETRAGRAGTWDNCRGPVP